MTEVPYSETPVSFLRHRTTLYLTVGFPDGCSFENAIIWLTDDEPDWHDPSKLRLWRYDDWTMMGRTFPSKKHILDYVQEFSESWDGPVTLECPVTREDEEDSITEFNSKKPTP